MSLDSLHKQLLKHSRTVVGLPIDQTPFPWTDCVDFGYTKCSQAVFMNFKLNNLGDPFQESAYAVNTFEQERELVREVGKLFHLTNPWGYVTDCGSTGNFAGVRAGLEQYPDAVVYASDRVHCSVDKACRLARAKLVKVRSNADHSINIEALHLAIEKHRPCGTILVLTAGTVMAGAVDSVTALDDPRYIDYVHVDAALAGFLLPYVSGPAFDFAYGIDSLSVSGHKMLGVPQPCGLFLSRHKPEVSKEYGTSQTATIGGSRSGLAAMLMLHAMRTHAMKQRAEFCLDQAAFLFHMLGAIGWPCERVSEWSNIVLLQKPSDAIVRKWSLATEGDTSHVICMPHVNADLVDEFVRDLKGGVR